jgi:hypothetical protein
MAINSQARARPDRRRVTTTAGAAETRQQKQS